MSRLLSRWPAKSPIIDATEVQAELGLALSALCGQKILRPTAPAAAYTCNECGDRQPLTYLSGVDDKTHAYLHCQGCGVYEVNGDSLRRWEIDTIALLKSAFQGLQLAIRAEVSGQLWQIGKAKWAGRIREVWFVRGSSLEQADQVTRALKSRPKAIVFCPTEASVTRWSERLPNLLLALESTLSLGETGISFDTGYVESRIVDTHAGEISPTERRRPQMRGVRLADIEKLCDALVEHIKSAKEYASHVAGKTGTSELWPRLTQEGLGVLVKFRKYRVNRCLNDSRAERLRDLWEDAQNLDQLMPLGKRSQGKKKTA
ncbi:hypothetical protein NA78x_002815 [Anatilimnocola sp. NA78]|uniref:hypothetical protein n=1 Tax=Anatilimnocola sp. NA78 TaxID=3415683 RepID=UPI003CE5867F